MLRYFSVDCDADGNVTAVELDADYIASITEEVAREYAAFAMARGQTYGFVSQYRYKIAQNENGYCVVFLNAEREMGNIRSLFWLTGGIALASIALLTVLITRLFPPRHPSVFAQSGSPKGVYHQRRSRVENTSCRHLRQCRCIGHGAS